MRISDWSSDVCSSDLAARHRNTTTSDSTRVKLLCEPASRSSYDNPVNSRPTPGGNCCARRSTVAIASPLLKPGAAWPRICTAGRRSDEHTSELQSLMRNSYAVTCLKTKIIHNHL